MTTLVSTIRQLLEQGATPRDIAILVRTNKYIPLIAAYFEEHMPDIRIISDEAFRLDSSVTLCLLTQALHLLTHPDDLLAKATIVKLYHRSVLSDSAAENELLIKDRSLDTLLPDAFINQFDELRHLPLYDIHKSKGLEFTHVLIPFCDWRLEMPDVLWCEPNEAPFDALPIAPIDFSSSQMRGTIYEHDYLDEHLQNIVDNLNLLYVAFTRAAHSLFVIGQRGSKSNRSALIEKVLPNLELDNSTLSGEKDEQAPLLFTYGTTDAVSTSTTPVAAPTVSDFITGNDDQQEAPSYIKMGCVLHEIFSTIRTTADIDTALRQLQYDGVLYDDEVTANKLTAMLHKRLEGKRVKDWFSDRWQLFNECSILRLNEQNEVVERRPDRVMTDGKETHVVDFKFGRPKPEYLEQVREYMQSRSANICNY